MPSLHELQRQLAAALFDGTDTRIAAELSSHDIDANVSLGIYRAQLHETFRRTLALEYPVIEALVGADYFRQLAREFQAAHPSRSGDLHPIGASFAGFLQLRFRDGPYPYLSDVAALEWACEESMTAAAGRAFDARELEAIDPAHYAHLQFALHPACRLVSSAYPVLDIWRANQVSREDTPVVDLKSRATHLLLLRPRGRVQFHRLSASQYALLEALAAGMTLGAALDAALCIEAAFDLAAALRKFAVLGAFTGAALQMQMPAREYQCAG